MKHPLCIPLLVAFAAAVNVSGQPGTVSSGPEEAIELSPFSVTAEAETAYGATQGSSGRLALSYLDTPQATAVVTSELIKDANLFTSNDAFKFVPGVTQAIQLNGVQSIRGLRTGGTYTDGFSNGGQLIFDTSFADRVEVVKGPSSTSFGRGDPAGFMNYVSKRPRFRNETEVGLMVGTGNDERGTTRVSIDSNGLVAGNSRTGYRFVFTHNEGALTMDLSEFSRTGAQLSLAHLLKNGRGRLDVISSYLRAKNSGAEYATSMTDEIVRAARAERILVDNNIVATPFEVFDGDYAFGYDATGINQNIFRTTVIFDYKLSEHWRTRQAGSFVDVRDTGRWAGYNSDRVFRAADGTLMFNVLDRTRYNLRNQKSVQSDFLGDYRIESMGAQVSVLFGGDYNEIDSTDGGQIKPLTAQPLYAWNRGIVGKPFAADDDQVARHTTGNNWSLYAQAQVKLLEDKVQLTAAGRRIYEDATTFNRANGATTINDARSPLLPTYSILIKPLQNLSLYASHSEHLEPSSVVPEYSNLQASDPRTSLTITVQPTTKLDEIGLRASVLNGQLTFSVTSFSLTSQGAGVSIPQAELLPSGPYTFTRRVLSDSKTTGWEFEMFGQISKRLMFTLGGHKISARNKVPAETTEHMGDIVFGYATYRFGESRYQGLSVTAGWKTYLSGWTLPSPTTYELRHPDDLHLVDLGFSYGFRDRYEVYVKGTNIFHDKGVTINQQAPGSGRLLYLGINARY